ncbi:MAG: hypothetical protein ACR2KT_08935, partial [Methylocella sp.]
FTLPGSTLVCAAPFLACLGAAPALAASPVTFVSGKGADTGDCPPARSMPARSMPAPSIPVMLIDWAMVTPP